MAGEDRGDLGESRSESCPVGPAEHLAGLGGLGHGGGLVLRRHGGQDGDFAPPTQPLLSSTRDIAVSDRLRNPNPVATAILGPTADGRTLRSGGQDSLLSALSALLPRRCRSPASTPRSSPPLARPPTASHPPWWPDTSYNWNIDQPK